MVASRRSNGVAYGGAGMASDARKERVAAQTGRCGMRLAAWRVARRRGGDIGCRRIMLSHIDVMRVAAKRRRSKSASHSARKISKFCGRTNRG